MKALKFGAVVIIAAGLAVVVAFSKNTNYNKVIYSPTVTEDVYGTKPENTNAALVAPSPTATTSRFEKENIATRNDIINLRSDMAAIDNLKQALKRDCKNHNSAAVISDKHELMKAQADRKKDLAYLSADKKELVRSHNLAISNCRKAVNKEKADLAASRKQLNRDIDLGNTADIGKDASLVTRDRLHLNKGETRLATEKSLMNSDMATLNRDIKEMNYGKAETETATAYTEDGNE